MARNVGTFVENGFVKGLITEATGLNFPEQAAYETWNLRYDDSGEVSRRLGIDHEDGYLNAEGSPQTGVVTRSYLWRGIGYEGNKTLLTVQSGEMLYFFEADEAGIFSTGLQPFSVNMSSYKSPGLGGVTVGLKEAQFASGTGRLFVTHPYCEPFYVEYLDSSNNISVNAIDVRIRDTEGITSEYDVDERPSTLTNEHKYNLYNQGWYPTVECGTGTNTLEGKGDRQVIDWWNTSQGDYPSNADMWWYFKDSAERFNDKQMRRFIPGNSQAGRGHYIFSAWDQDRAAVSGISGVSGYNSAGFRPGCCAFFAGRFWMGGVGHPKYANNLYYSQIIENIDYAGLCYQKNDPSSENLSDLLDTDGGQIKIPDMGQATAFFTQGPRLIVFANNGIWVIAGSGADGTGFVATDFAVSRISAVPLYHPNSLVDVEGSPIWWNYDGIYTLASDGQGGMAVKSLSDETIRKFIKDEIPAESRIYCQGAYNSLTKTIQWIYSSIDGETDTDFYTYDRILELNLITGAFYPFSFTRGDQRISSVFVATGIIGSDAGVIEVPLTDDDGNIIYSGGADDVSEATLTYDTSAMGIIWTSAGNTDSYMFTGDNALVKSTDGDWFVIDHTIQSSPRTLRWMHFDHTTDTISNIQTMVANDFGDDLETYGVSFTGTAKTALENVTWVSLYPLEYIFCTANVDNVSHEYIYWGLYTVDGAGVLTMCGGGRMEFGGSSQRMPQQPGWIGLNAGHDITDEVVMAASASNGSPALFVFPKVMNMLNTVYDEPTAVGDANFRWMTDIFNKAGTEYWSSRAAYQYDQNGTFWIDNNQGYSFLNFYIGPSQTQAHIDNAGSGNQDSFTDDAVTQTLRTKGFIGKINLSYLSWNGSTWPTSYDYDTDDYFQSSAGAALGSQTDMEDWWDGDPFKMADGTVFSDGKARADFARSPSSMYTTAGDFEGLTLTFWSALLYDQGGTADALGGGTYKSALRLNIFGRDGINWRRLANITGEPFDRVVDFSFANAADNFYVTHNKCFFCPTNNTVYLHGSTYDASNTAARRSWIAHVAVLGISGVGEEPVTETQYTIRRATSTAFKYVGANSFLSFLEEVDTTYYDFVTRYGAATKDYSSYLITGARIRGEGQKTQQVEYITVFTRNVTNSSCKLQARWDWANTGSSGAWSVAQEAFRQEVVSANRPFRDVIRKRLLLRGSGNAVQLYFKSVAGKPFNLIGWSTMESTDSVP